MHIAYPIPTKIAHEDHANFQRDISNENMDKSYIDDLSEFAQNLKYAHELSQDHLYGILS